MRLSREWPTEFRRNLAQDWHPITDRQVRYRLDQPHRANAPGSSRTLSERRRFSDNYFLMSSMRIAGWEISYTTRHSGRWVETTAIS